MLIACQDLPGSPPFAPEPPLKNICLPCFPEEGPHQPAAKPRGLPQRGEGARLGEDLPVLGLSFSRQLPHAHSQAPWRAARHNFAPMASGKGRGRKPSPALIWNSVNVW